MSALCGCRKLAAHPRREDDRAWRYFADVTGVVRPDPQHAARRGRQLCGDSEGLVDDPGAVPDSGFLE